MKKLHMHDETIGVIFGRNTNLKKLAKNMN